MFLLLERFALYLRQERNRQPATIIRYKKIVIACERYLRSRSPALTFESADKHALRGFLSSITTDEPSPSGFNQRVAALRAFYEFLGEEEIVTANPALLIRRQRTQRKKPIVPPTLDEFIRIYDAVDAAPKRLQSRDRAILLIAYFDLFRGNEIRKLDLPHVDTQEHLFDEVQVKGGKVVSLEMPDIVAEALDKAIADRHLLNPKPGVLAVFLSQRGTRISLRTMEARFDLYARAAGIRRDVWPHLLRHTGSTAYSEQGETEQTIASIASQDSVDTTRRYIHVQERIRRKAMTTAERRFKKRLAKLKRGGKVHSGELRVTEVTRSFSELGPI